MWTVFNPAGKGRREWSCKGAINHHERSELCALPILEEDSVSPRPALTPATGSHHQARLPERSQRFAQAPPWQSGSKSELVWFENVPVLSPKSIRISPPPTFDLVCPFPGRGPRWHREKGQARGCISEDVVPYVANLCPRCVAGLDDSELRGPGHSHTFLKTKTLLGIHSQMQNRCSYTIFNVV